MKGCCLRQLRCEQTVQSLSPRPQAAESEPAPPRGHDRKPGSTELHNHRKASNAPRYAVAGGHARMVGKPILRAS